MRNQSEVKRQKKFTPRQSPWKSMLETTSNPSVTDTQAYVQTLTAAIKEVVVLIERFRDLLHKILKFNAGEY